MQVILAKPQGLVNDYGLLYTGTPVDTINEPLRG